MKKLALAILMLGLFSSCTLHYERELEAKIAGYGIQSYIKHDMEIFKSPVVEEENLEFVKDVA